MRALVTGAAGFVGSHLAEHLVSEGHEVRAVDALTPYYVVALKRENWEAVGRAGCELVSADLRTAELGPLLEGIDVVFHQSGQPGVRSSWDAGFGSYVEQNVLVTQRLLEAIRGGSVERFVYASSSSIYGNALAYPVSEDDLPRPQSPYGVTKLAAEHLCGVYARTFGVPTVSLRYFTVYGPRQRPDMAMHRLIEAALSGRSFPMYGNGRQIRDFTFVGDVARANVLAATAPVRAGEVINVAGGSSTSLLEVVETIEELVGRPVQLDRQGPQAGDVERTGGSIERAHELLRWTPSVSLGEGLSLQLAWHRARRAATVAA
jgi:nucleoside-diphosphate-sugar epimerase